MSRRKVRGLTKTGRQVSEDPDLDSLLSNLSPEEMEELQKEVSVVPDPDPSEIIVVDQTDLKPTAPLKKESQQSSQTDDFRSRLQRNLSTEGEPKKESRKQEYLRKMGLSQEKNTSVSDSKDGGLQRTPFTSSFSKRDGRKEDRTRRVTEGSKDDKFGPYALSRKDEESEKQEEVKEQNDGSKFKDRREMRESSSSKTKELISKLQEKKEDSKEKNRKEDSCKRESGESRAKAMISRIKDKEEKERERKEEIRKREEIKTKGYTNRLEEKQNQVLEDKTKEEKKFKEENQIRRLSEKVKKSPMLEVKELPENKEKEPEKTYENVWKPQEYNAKSSNKGRGDVQKQNEIENEVHEPINKQEKIGNCVSDIISKSKTKEEEEEDESASMFDEDLERVRCNDPSMTDLNVNNSEVIKTKTLIQFAEALKNNTHIKVFSLANCRADDHVAYAIAETLRNNKSITSINLDSNLLTSKGVMSLIHALQHNSTLTELRFHNQRHIIGGKSEMEMTKILKENTTLLKLGYHFELAGPRMTMTNILSRNMDRQRQKRLQEQKQAQAQGIGDKKDTLEVPKPGFGKGSPKASPRPSPITSPIPSPAPSPKLTHKKRVSGLGGGPPPPPPPPGGPPPPPPPMLDGDFLKNSLTPMSQRKLDDRRVGRGGAKNSRDQLLASIRGSNIKQLKKVALPELLQ
ncbi:leiomodin-1-like [Sinocyclocheilus anshuiensis]|uniref:Leiomodin-1 n=1 Tax=Sinocyclocheilus anshuiensis TaxID=1608454 RepID=A0A671PFI3_9TELE|nr:PREDICTED: leiomodin-1-like [Sinocyclocheilus anshuiensis]